MPHATCGVVAIQLGLGENFFLNRLNFSFFFPALRPKLLKIFSKTLRKQPNQGPKWHFSQLRRQYLLSLAIGRSDTAKITPFEKYVNKFCVSRGSERKKSLTVRVFEWCPPLKSPNFLAISRSQKSPNFLKNLRESLTKA